MQHLPKSRKNRPGANHRRLFAGAMVGIVTILLGGAGVAWHAHSALQKDAGRDASKVLKHIEFMLRNAQGTAHAAAELTTLDCEAALPRMRELVQATLYVRSVNLLDSSNNLYCSSLLGPTTEPIDVSKYAEGQLRLLHGNLITPNSPLLVYRYATPTGGALAAVDGRHVIDLVALTSANALMQVWIGAEQLGTQRPGSNTSIKDGIAPAWAVSSAFPVKVYAAFPLGTFGAVIVHDYLGLLLLFAVLACISGARTYWLLGRRYSAKAEMARAIQNGEFVVYLQPLVSAKTFKWVGAEVLARWINTEGDLISPNAFIPLAEENGLIVPMTQALMKQVADAFREHRLSQKFDISVNVSNAILQSDTFVAECRDLLGSFPGGTTTLVLELTERDLIVAAAPTLRVFKQLREVGVKLAIDDFGTGYCGLSYLQEFDIDVLKIDRTFVANLDTNELSQTIILNILDLCKKLGLKAVAEGIESASQREFLCAHHADLLQGYLFSPPLPLAEFLQKMPGRI